MSLSLADVCTNDYATAALPASGFFSGITIDSSSVNATVTYNYTASDSVNYPDATFDYCQVQFSYAHDGRDDEVNVRYWLPAPDKFENRFLATGGAGLAINMGTSSVAGGIQYGAVSGYTDGGFGSFDAEYDEVTLLANGSLNYDLLYEYGYLGIYELTVLGKEFTSNFFNVSGSDDDKLYAYYQGCSEGGREGWSQIQRFYDELDGAITGAPAFRYSFLQVNHLLGNIIFQTLNYTPPPCELAAIVNYTIAACDPLDGKTDGVISRSDLCVLDFDLTSLVGQPYYCAAEASSTSAETGETSSATPEQEGTISELGVQVAQLVADGLHDSAGQRVYVPYRLGAEYSDETATWDSDSESWYLEPSSLAASYVQQLLRLQNLTSFSDLDGVTFDTLRDWIYHGWQKYDSVLQTTWPDLTLWQQAGKKILHYHGESDPSIPTASSIHYHEAVRAVMYPHLSFNESTAALAEWYQFYLVPGGAHCGTNDLQPNAPFPQTTLAVLIDWVERGHTPTRLNATFLDGDWEGETTQLCPWPLRPYWYDNSTLVPDCVYDQASIDTWLYDIDAFKQPVY